jgi:hypothetical protein
MAATPDSLAEHLASRSKAVRLKAVKLLLLHPQASPLQLAQCLCSPDNRNFEFLEVFDLGHAMRASWSRLAGSDDPDVFDFLVRTYPEAPRTVEHVLERIGTSRALELRDRLGRSVDPGETS